MILAFFKYAGKGNLDAMCPVISVNIDNWCKSYEPKKAFVFTEDEMRAIYKLDNTVKTIVMKAWAVCSVAVAGREGEVHDLNFEDLDREIVKGKAQCTLFFYRTKQGIRERVKGLVVGKLEMDILDRYVSCFPMGMRTGRLFRYVIDFCFVHTYTNSNIVHT